MVDRSRELPVLSSLVRFFRTGPDRPALDDPRTVRRAYERKRWSVFVSITLGYGVFYVCRNNFGMVRQPMIDEGVFSATQLGLIGSTFYVVYAIGKLVNGFLADHSNIARFMSTGLLLSAVASFLLGWTTSFVVFILLWGFNGWCQTTGSAPSVALLSQWFSSRERGTRYGLWSISHNIGEGLSFVATGALISALGWRFGFFGPGVLCAGAALVLYKTLADRPQTYGLPPVEAYKEDAPPQARDKQSVGRDQLKVLRNPAVWILGLASAMMYIARYGVTGWGPFFLQKGKGYEMVTAGTVLACSSIAAMLGAASSGWISDRFFGSRRNVPILLFGLVETGALTAFYLIPPGHFWLDALSMVGFGFALGGSLVFLGGLFAVDLCSRKAAGAAMGMVGVFSYLGAAVQDTVSGRLVDLGRVGEGPTAVYDFSRVFAFWIGASVLSLVLACSLWRVRPKS